MTREEWDKLLDDIEIVPFSARAARARTTILAALCKEPSITAPPSEVHLDAFGQIYTAAKLILERQEPVSEAAENIQRIAAAVIYSQDVPRLYKPVRRTATKGDVRP